MIDHDTGASSNDTAGIIVIDHPQLETTPITSGPVSDTNTDLLSEVVNSIKHQFHDINDPDTQTRIFTGLLISFLLLGVYRWFTSKPEDDTTQSLEVESIQTKYLEIDLPPCQLMDVCSIDDKAILEEYQIMDSYTSVTTTETANSTVDSPRNSVDSSEPASSDSFERHESRVDNTDSENLDILLFSTPLDSNSTAAKQLYTPSVASSPTRSLKIQSPTRSQHLTYSASIASTSPSKLVFQNSNFSVLKTSAKYPPQSGGAITIGDVTQETVYSTSFNGSDTGNDTSSLLSQKIGLEL
jgi:hypothetical protein